MLFGFRFALDYNLLSWWRSNALASHLFHRFNLTKFLQFSLFGHVCLACHILAAALCNPYIIHVFSVTLDQAERALTRPTLS